MAKNNLIFSKILVMITVLIATISLSLFSLFGWGTSLKNNIAVIITLIVNKEPIISSFYQQLMASNFIVSLYIFAVLLIFNLTYLVPLIFIKKPFAKSVFAIYMLLMTLVLVVMILILFNFFHLKNFETITINNLWTIPWVAIALSLVTIFWYGLKNLWLNPRQLPKNINPKTKKDVNDNNLPSYHDLQLQLKMIKKQLKEVKNIKLKKI